MNKQRFINIFIGLPYTGKTTIIRYLNNLYPGKEIIADAIFNKIVSSEERSLERWLAEGPQLADSIIGIIDKSTERILYIELGIMQRQNRRMILNWTQEHEFTITPFWLQNENSLGIMSRYGERVRDSDNNDQSKINIEPGELYRRIMDNFEEPVEGEEFIHINTSCTIEESIKEIKLNLPRNFDGSTAAYL